MGSTPNFIHFLKWQKRELGFTTRISNGTNFPACSKWLQTLYLQTSQEEDYNISYEYQF